MLGSDTESSQHSSARLDQDEDLRLVQAIARRDRKAFEALYYRYSPRLGRYLMRMLRQRELVDEAINDVMLVVWQSAERYDPTAARLSTWLFGIAHNKGLKALTRSSRHAAELSYDSSDVENTAESYDANDPGAQADPDNPERTLMGRQLGQALSSALDSLSAEHRAVIDLAFGEDCSYQEIAAIVGCPVNTVKTRVFHARKRLAELLAARGVN